MKDATDPRHLPRDDVDVVVPNAAEARALVTGLGADSVAVPADGLAAALVATTGTRTVVVTLDANGCVVAGLGVGVGGSQRRAAVPVDRVVDTTRASDAFTAALAYHLGTGTRLVRSLLYGLAWT